MNTSSTTHYSFYSAFIYRFVICCQKYYNALTVYCKPNRTVSQIEQHSWQEIESEIGQQQHIIFPCSLRRDRSPGNRQDRVLCTHNRGLRLRTFQQSYSGSSQTQAIKTGQLQTPATLIQSLGLRRAEPLRRQGWHVGFSEWWKVKMVVWRISQQGGIAGRTSMPLPTHPSSCSLWSPSGAVPMVCANLSMLCGVWSWDKIIIITLQMRLQMQTCQLRLTSGLIIPSHMQVQQWKELPLSHADRFWKKDFLLQACSNKNYWKKGTST